MFRIGLEEYVRKIMEQKRDLYRDAEKLKKVFDFKFDSDGDIVIDELNMRVKIVYEIFIDSYDDEIYKITNEYLYLKNKKDIKTMPKIALGRYKVVITNKEILSSEYDEYAILLEDTFYDVDKKAYIYLIVPVKP